MAERPTPQERKSLIHGGQGDRLTEFALRRRAADLEGLRFLIQADKIIRYLNEVATGRRLVTRRTAVRVQTGLGLLKKVVPDLTAIDVKGLFAFAPMSARAEALSRLSGEELDQFIALAAKLKAVPEDEHPPIDGEARRVEGPAGPEVAHGSAPLPEVAPVAGPAGPKRGNGQDRA